MPFKFKRKKVPDRTVMQLIARAGGRCEFWGCNKFVMEEELTLHKVRTGHVAHIVAASPDGPRGDDSMPLKDRNNLSNLMLLCTDHHAVVDDKQLETEYPKNRLQTYKSDHEDLIKRLTDYRPEGKATVVRLRAVIRGNQVSVPVNAYRAAMMPRYPADEAGIEIDLTKLPSFGTEEYWKLGADWISKAIAPLWEPGTEKQAVERLAVFALAPIPLLVHLGTCLTNKIPADLFQRHRDDESWTWRESGLDARYELSKHNEHVGADEAGLMLSLSGVISMDALPSGIRTDLPLYEIRLASEPPTTTFLRKRSDLVAFTEIYQRALAQIRAENPTCTRIHLFPAVPAPIAVACGRELLEIHPSLVVYEPDAKTLEFKEVLEVNA